MCVADCYYTHCTRSQHKVATSYDLLLNPTLDYSAAIKEPCRFCEFFLSNAPHVTVEEN
jgi:hypothetical protein